MLRSVRTFFFEHVLCETQKDSTKEIVILLFMVVMFYKVPMSVALMITKPWLLGERFW